MAEQIKTDICPNPSCGKKTIMRQKGDDRDHDVVCDVCGVMVRVPANFTKSVTMFTVQVGDGPKEPIYSEEFFKKKGISAYC